MPITIGSNIASLRTQRELSKSSDALTTVFERLSSGQRINRASDDAAGLAIATSLNANSRIFTQSIRNVNDGISTLSIMQGATGAMSDIVMRLSELSESAANGTYSTSQRRALNTEAQALREEFNRIVDTTKFNGVSLLSDSTGSTIIQAGYTATNALLSLSSGNTSAGYKGTGALASGASITGSVGSTYTSIGGDFNNDGRVDVVAATSNGLYVSLQNSDGTFAASISYAPSASISGATDVQAADLNGDGILDLVAGVAGGSGITATILFGNSDGSFGAGVNLAGVTGADQVEIGDLNNDGRLDIVASNSGSATVSVYLATGSGSYSSATTFTADNAQGLELSDFNNDGKLDIVTTNLGAGKISILNGNGNGTFQAQLSIASLADNRDLTVSDINGDGLEDIIVSSNSGGSIGVMLATGAGTFAAAVSYSAGGTSSRGISAGDFNGDGITDIAVMNTSGSTSIGLLLANSNGSFNAAVTFAQTVGSGIGLSVQDMNNDGVVDVISPGSGQSSILFSNATGTSKLGAFDLTTRGGALSGLEYFSGVRTRLSQAIGGYGSDESRFSVALKTLSVTRENYQSAYSRIMDTDVAETSSQLLITQIKQQAAAAVLSQANQLPALALSLLR